MIPQEGQTIMSNEQYQPTDHAPLTGNQLAEAGDTQTPIGTGGFGTGDDLGPIVEESTGSKLNSSAFVIAFLLVCAGGVIFWMKSTTSSNNAALAANSEVEHEIDSLLETMEGAAGRNPLEEGDNVIKALTSDRTERQVPVEDVKKNPLILITDENRDAPKNTTPKNDTASDQEKKLQAARKRIEDASKQIVVNSIMSGSNPLASLNGKIVRVGDTISVGPEKVKFKVEAIDAGSVELTSESKEFDLELGFTVVLDR